MGYGTKLTVVLALLLTALAATASGCSDGSGSGSSDDSADSADSRTSGGQTTGREEGRIRVRQVAEGQRGLAERRVVVAGSATELGRATGLPVPDSGEGLYVSAHAGERPTGGYRVSISGSGPGEIRVGVREPGEGDIVTQALTRPYAIAVVGSGSGQPPEPGELRFVDEAGSPLGWPVRRL